MSVNVMFLPAQITVTAQPGEPLLDVATRAGVPIRTSCLVGACRACQVKIAGQKQPVRACLETVPTTPLSIIHLVYNQD